MKTVQVIVIDPKQKKLYSCACKYADRDITPGLREIIGAPDIVGQNEDGLKSFLSSISATLGTPKYDYGIYGQDSACLKGEDYFEFGGINIGIGMSVIFAYDPKQCAYVDCQYLPDQLRPYFKFLSLKEAAEYKDAMLHASLSWGSCHLSNEKLVAFLAEKKEEDEGLGDYFLESAW